MFLKVLLDSFVHSISVTDEHRKAFFDNSIKSLPHFGAKA
jgi:hypothetical protein